MTIQNLRIVSIASAVLIGFWLPLRLIGYTVSDSINLFCDIWVPIVSAINVYLHFKEKDVGFFDFKEWLNPTVILDLICFLPLALIDRAIFDQQHNSLLLLNYLTCRHIWGVKSYLDYFPTLHAVYYRLIPIVMMMPLLVHSVACGWIFLGSGTAGPNEDQVTEYIKASYWALTTLTTVGYGDITPKTNIQMLFAGAIEFVGVAVFGFIVSNVASLLSRIDAAREHHMDNIDRVETFLHSHHFPPEMRLKVRRYFNFLWKRHKGFQDRSLLRALPNQIQSELFLFINQPVIKKVALFKDASADMIEALMHELHPKIYVPGEKVFHLGDVGDGLYFIHHGEVEILDKNSSIIATLKDGAFFGETALVSDQLRNATARCLNYCDMYVLPKKSFEKVLADHPEFRHHIEKVADQRRSKSAA